MLVSVRCTRRGCSLCVQHPRPALQLCHDTAACVAEWRLVADWQEAATAQSACAGRSDCLSTGRRHEGWQCHVPSLPCRNGELVNPFKVDLHALYVAEALARLEETIISLRRMKCELPCPHHVLPDTCPYPCRPAVTCGSGAVVGILSAGTWQLEIITGRGRHSEGNKPRLQPAVLDWLSDHQIEGKVSPTNPGAVLANIPSAGE